MMNKLKLGNQNGCRFRRLTHDTDDSRQIVARRSRWRSRSVVTAVAKAAFNSAVDAVRAGGRVVAVGLPPESMSLDIPRLVLDGIEVVGSLVARVRI